MQITIKGLFIVTSIVVLVAIIILFIIIKTEKYEMEWTENKRNNVSFNKYPPCYDICGSTRNIYDEIERTGKLEEYKNATLSVLDDDKKKIEKDLNTLFSNQKTVLSVINALRARINNQHGKTQKTKNPSLKERFKSIERRDADINED
jgi:hypothetical protein